MNEKFKILDLFSGIGGFSLGLERTGGFETVAFCEIDPFCRKVLAKHWPGVPIHEDVRELTADAVGHVDVITGGYPCQPFSLAGKRAGEEDDRHLWPEMYRLVAELRPAWVIGENVFGHISMGLDQVLSDLETLDYTCRPFVVPACAVDAPHRRDRVWIVANAKRGGRGEGDLLDQANDEQPTRKGGAAIPAESSQTPASVADPDCTGGGMPTGALVGEEGQIQAGGKQFRPRTETRNSSGDVADPDCSSTQGGRIPGGVYAQHADADSGSDGIGESSALQWLPEPDVGRVANGIPDRVGRLRSLGNAVVPQIPEIIGRAILMAEAT
jgi:DNA (cytosine-5)-methyltransferase 1